jgi:pteridine reductase
MNLIDTVAIVTGAGRRVGRAIALELATAGCDVVVHFNRSGDVARETADAIREVGRRAAPVQADLDQPDAACSALLHAATELGPLGVLVNNASIYQPGTPDSLPDADLQRMQRVNVIAPTMLVERSADALATGRGCAINILDAQARRPWPRYLAYSTTKSALAAATRGLARKLAPAVRVNGVAPGTVAWNDQDDDADRDAILAQIPLGRFGDPDDVARAVRFLAQQSYITGQVINVDGGRFM